MNIHLPGLPHTETTKAFDWCAFTSKLRKFSTMLHELGHAVYLYASEANEASCTEHIPVVRRADQEQWFGQYDWNRDLFNDYNAESVHFSVMNTRAIEAIRERAKPGDILGLIGGYAQKPLADAFPDMRVVEWGIGYPGVFAPYRVFESYAWAHYLAQPDDVRFYDTVIPNSFEAELFPKGDGAGDYYLYFGRLVNRKGPHIAAEACKRLGAKLILAGQGVATAETGRVVALDGTEILGDVEHIGVVTDAADRAALMGGATAIFVPTTYLEPFGAVAVEAMMTGTPAITTDWGAFTETVQNGVSGYRCRSLRDFVEAGEAVRRLDRRKVRAYSESRYSIQAVAPQYDAYLRKLQTLDGEGWYA